MALTRINNQAMTNVTSDGLPAKTTGEVVQVQTVTYTDTFSQTNGSYVDTKINNISVSITPKSTSNKIIVEAQVNSEGNSDDHDFVWFFYRDSTVLKAPVDGSRRSGVAMHAVGFRDSDNQSTSSTTHLKHIDSPSTTSEVTYHLGINGPTQIHINRTLSDGNSSGYERCITNMTVTEIAG